jgi:hypothetical protein
MVASFKVVTVMWVMPAVVSYGNVPGRNGNDYFVMSVSAVVFPDKGAAGKGYCHYRNYDGSY